jgi:hypothetical protein
VVAANAVEAVDAVDERDVVEAVDAVDERDVVVGASSFPRESVKNLA